MGKILLGAWRFLWVWVVRPFLALLAARTAYALVQGVFGFDPGQRAAATLLGAPHGAWVEIGRWAIFGVPALIVLLAYEIWRSRNTGWTVASGARRAENIKRDAGQPSSANARPVALRQPWGDALQTDWKDQATERDLRIYAGLEIDPHALKLDIGESGYFCTLGPGTLYTIGRTLNLKIENIDKHKLITDCQVHLMAAIPPINELPITIRSCPHVGAGSSNRSAFVSYTELREPDKAGHQRDANIRLQTNSGQIQLPAATEHFFKLRGTCIEAAYYELCCKVWVDASGRLRIERIENFTSQPAIERSTFVARTGGEISARNAQVPPNLPFTLGRAETGGRIVMDGIKFVVASADPKPEPTESTYMTAYEVMHYLADMSAWGVWTRDFVGADGMKKLPLLEAYGEFKRIAESGVIECVGRKDGKGEHELIPPLYWISATIDPNCIGNCSISQTMMTSPEFVEFSIYKDLRVRRSDVYKAWPRADGVP